MDEGTVQGSMLVQTGLGLMGLLQGILLFGFGFLFSRIKDAETKAEKGDLAVLNSVEKALQQFEKTVREQRERLDEARETMLTKAEWREDLKELRSTLDRASQTAEASRSQVMDRMADMAIAAERVKSQAEAVATQIQNFVETQAELTTAVSELKIEVQRRSSPLSPLVGGG